jgi:hypothetical protein
MVVGDARRCDALSRYLPLPTCPTRPAASMRGDPVNKYDSPEPRPIQGPDAGRIITIPEVGGLHHRYERRAA